MGEVIILDKVFPEYQVHAKFISYHLNRALGLDAKLSSHPIEVECPDANKANQGPPVYDDRNLVVNTGAPKDPPCSCPSSTCYRHREYSEVPGTSNLLAPRQPNRLLKEQVCFRVMYTIIRILILTSFWHSIIHPLEYKIIRKI